MALFHFITRLIRRPESGSVVQPLSRSQSLSRLCPPPWAGALIGTGVLAVTAAVLLKMGRVPICTCGHVKFWQGDVNSPQNSQQIADWYSFSHVIHGFAFYFILWLLARRAPLGWRVLMAIVPEAAWEIIENTPTVIERYRHATIALHYYGDSVINSLSDVLFMVVGFMLASRLPVWATIGLTIFFEALTAYAIRDNLLLNVIMLVYPVEAIRSWQAAG